MIIEQFHSIGDLLFLEPLYRHFFKRDGVKPIVPVRDHLLWLGEYIDSATFIRESEYRSREFKEPKLDLMHANQIMNYYPLNYHLDFENCMMDKYLIAGLIPSMWTDIRLKFKDNKSDKLLQHLGLINKNGVIQEYILVNENNQAGRIDINPKTDIRVVKMYEVPGYTVIDWHMVILMAEENHHVSTSTFYLMQAIKNQYDFNSRVVLYPRPNIDGLRGISKLRPTFTYKKAYL